MVERSLQWRGIDLLTGSCGWVLPVVLYSILWERTHKGKDDTCQDNRTNNLNRRHLRCPCYFGGVSKIQWSYTKVGVLQL